MSDEKRCTCNDDWPTEPCPICSTKEGTDVTESFQASQAVVTDANLVSSQPEFLQGHLFVCPSCGKHSVLHFFRHCPNCGMRLVVQSVTVRDTIRKINQVNKTT